MQKTLSFAWLPFLFAATPAFAHSPVPGFEGFYVGLLHPFATPSHAILMIGLGLLVAGFAVETARWQLVAFFAATLAGLIIALRIEEIDAIMFAAAVGACTLAALIPGKLAALALIVACLGGFLVGDASIPDAGPVRDRVITMSGSIVGANLGLLYLFGSALFLKERYTWPWVAIAFRVAAAWLGAIALVMLALGYAEGAAAS